MKRSFEFNLDACIGEYTKRPATVAPSPTLPEPKPEPVPEPEPEPAPEAPEAQSAAQKMLHELINGPPPLLTPLAVLQPQAQAQPPPLPMFTPEALPDPHRHRHAGILREFGGVREWMKTRDAHDAPGASTA